MPQILKYISEQMRIDVTSEKLLPHVGVGKHTKLLILLFLLRLGLFHSFALSRMRFKKFRCMGTSFYSLPFWSSFCNKYNYFI
jgi:hypothetical protein